MCPLTPEETALILRALDIDNSYQIYIAAGEIYGGARRMKSLATAYPNLVSCRSSTNSYGIMFSLFSPVSIISHLFVETGQKGDSAGVIRPQVFSKSFISDGSIRLSCFVGE